VRAGRGPRGVPGRDVPAHLRVGTEGQAVAVPPRPASHAADANAAAGSPCPAPTRSSKPSRGGFRAEAAVRWVLAWNLVLAVGGAAREARNAPAWGKKSHLVTRAILEGVSPSAKLGASRRGVARTGSDRSNLLQDRSATRSSRPAMRSDGTSG
jgi:hypothetical protein